MHRLEVCCFSPCAAVAAISAGAHRVELCRCREADGLTPSPDDVRAVLHHLATTCNAANSCVMVMVRPPPLPSLPPETVSSVSKAAAQFVVSEAERKEMVRYIREDLAALLANRVSVADGGDPLQAAVTQLGGVVIGGIVAVEADDGATPCWRVDTELVRRCVEALRDIWGTKAPSLQVTFHRAFDCCLCDAGLDDRDDDEEGDISDRDASIVHQQSKCGSCRRMSEDVEALAALGVTRILTSGVSPLRSGPMTLQRRIRFFRRLHALCPSVQSGRVIVVPGGGVDAAFVRTCLNACANGGTNCGGDGVRPVFTEFHGSFLSGATQYCGADGSDTCCCVLQGSSSSGGTHLLPNTGDLRAALQLIDEKNVAK